MRKNLIYLSILCCLVFFIFIFINIVNASVLLSDSFTGTTIDTAKWDEVDAGGLGGTAGNIQQNGVLTTTGASAWGANYIATDSTYDRTIGGLEIEAEITCSATNTIMGIGYGDPGVLTGGGQSYTVYTASRNIYFSRQHSNSNAENVDSGSDCTVGVPFSVRITIDDTIGASLYLNGSGTPAVTLTGTGGAGNDSMNNKRFFISGHSGGAASIDNVVISSAEAATEPDAPTDLSAIPGSTQMALTWTAPIDNGGASITDYVVEYKLSSEPTTWTTFNDGTSTTTSTTVTGLTNNLSYDFRVSAVNSIGTGIPSNTATETPVLSVPSSPQSLSATSGANGQSVLTWTTPTSNGGSAITDYIVEFKLNSEPTTWTTFNDGTSTNTNATVTGLTNGSLYNFRVKAVNAVGTSSASSTANATPNLYLFFDDFTGTTIDTDKWVESDAAGSGGTVGNVQQNGSLSTLGNNTWGANMLRTVDSFVRSNGNLTASVDVTIASCSGSSYAMALSYGGHLTSNSTYFAYYFNGGINFNSFSPAETATISPSWSCTDGVPFNLKLVILEDGGAEMYIDNVLKGTVSAGTYTGTFALQGYKNVVTFDNFTITESVTGPFAPTSLDATAGDGQVSLSWVSGGDNGSPITDYIVEYKLNSAGSWSTFTDGTSATTSATVTGLTNGSLYNFRVSAVNANGTSEVSSTDSATPVSATPTAPSASSVSISGTAAVDEQLTGTYTYTDVNGNAESGSTYRWLRATSADGSYSAIPGATSISYTVTEDDIDMYLKFEVTPVSIASPTTGSPALSSATAQVTEVNYLNQILSTGQSLSVGVAATPALSTTQPYNNKMLTGAFGGQGTGASFTPLIESSVETMSSSIANSLTYNDPGNDLDTVVSLHGVSGYTYNQLKKGTSPYNNGMTQVTNAKSAATALGRVLRVIGVTSIHGETDNYNGVSGATYQGYLEQWQSDYNTDVKAITGQSSNIPLFIDQMSSFMSSYANDATSEIPIYQLYASEDNPGDIVLVTPKYFFNYSDRHHLTAASSRWLGEYHAKVIKKVSINNESWRPLSPDSAIRSGNIIDVNFHVPAGVLAFDTTLVSARTNYGFEYYDTTSSASISSVAILDDDTVRITLSAVPTGGNQRIRYAYTGVPGTNTGAQNAGSAAGNLRDTDPYPSLYGNTLYNWAVHFDEAVTLDSTAPTITSISSDKANGSYGVGEVIDIDVTFSEYVTSTGNVTVTLETGDTDRTCTFTVSNSNTGTCNYTVQAGDNSSDLTVSSVSGTIADQQGNSMVNFTPATNLSTNKAIIIDTSSSAISSVSSTPSNTSVTITWTTDEASSSIVDYGLTNSYGTTTVEADTSPRVTSHSVTINNLIACTAYKYRVKSNDAASNLATSTGYTFTTDGCIGSPEIIAEETTAIDSSVGGTTQLTNGGNTIHLNIPAGALVDDAFYQIKIVDASDTLAGTGSPTGMTASNLMFHLKNIYDVNTSFAPGFDQSIEITVTYNEADLNGLPESSLVIWHYSSGAWTSLAPCIVDTNANTVTCSTDSFSIFGLFGAPSSPSQVVSTNGAVSVAFLQALSNQNNQTQTKTTIGCKEGYAFSPVNGLPCNNTKTNTNEFVAEKTKFTKNLKLGMKDTQVKLLQEYLNNNGFLVASTGPGSKGKETTLFGRATRNALIKFQKANNINPAVGYFGPLSRGFVNAQ